MSRRGLPDFSPNDLADHAAPARVERVWERLERDLPAPAAHAVPRRGLPLTLAFAGSMAAAFAGGLWAGKAADDAAEPPPVAVASSDRPAVEVLAAGTEARSFPIPGGGRLTLSPGATIEAVRAGADAVTLRLVQGEASVEASGGGAVSIVADEARLSAQAGSAVVVRRQEDTLDVRVLGGKAELHAPDGSRELERGQQADAVPLRALAFSTAAPQATARHPLSSRSRREPREAPASAAGAQGWRALHEAGSWAEAFDLLKSQPGGVSAAIDAAATAEELMSISDLAATAGDQATWARALRQVVDRFPAGPYAQLAAFKLGDAYDRMGETALAQKYLERAKKGVLAEDAFCQLLATETREGHKKEAARMAREYVAEYPNGRCRDDADLALQGDDAGDASAAPAPRLSSDAGAP